MGYESFVFPLYVWEVVHSKVSMNTNLVDLIRSRPLQQYFLREEISVLAVSLGQEPLSEEEQALAKKAEGVSNDEATVFARGVTFLKRLEQAYDQYAKELDKWNEEFDKGERDDSPPSLKEGSEGSLFLERSNWQMAKKEGTKEVGMRRKNYQLSIPLSKEEEVAIVKELYRCQQALVQADKEVDEKKEIYENRKKELREEHAEYIQNGVIDSDLVEKWKSEGEIEITEKNAREVSRECEMYDNLTKEKFPKEAAEEATNLHMDCFASQVARLDCKSAFERIAYFAIQRGGKTFWNAGILSFDNGYFGKIAKERVRKGQPLYWEDIRRCIQQPSPLTNIIGHLEKADLKPLIKRVSAGGGKVGGNIGEHKRKKKGAGRESDSKKLKE